MRRWTVMLTILVLSALSAAAQDPPLEAPVLHEIPLPFVSSMFAMSPDGTVIAVFEHAVMANNEPVGTSLPILLINTTDGSLIGRLDGVQVDLARDAAFSPDGTQLASYHLNGDLIVWDVATQEALAVYDWLPLGGGLIDYLPDGQSLSIMIGGQLGQHILFDLETGSITDILSVRPDTLTMVREAMGDSAAMGQYMVATQAVGPNGELFGATANGQVYQWDTGAHLRETLSPDSTEGPMRFNVRHLWPLPDDSLIFYDRDLEKTVKLAADGTRTEYPFKADAFTVSSDGVMIYYTRSESMIYRADLTAESPEPETIQLILPNTEDDQPQDLAGDLTLALTPAGDLVVGGFLPAGSMGAALYIIDLP